MPNNANTNIIDNELNPICKNNIKLIPKIIKNSLVKYIIGNITPEINLLVSIITFLKTSELFNLKYFSYGIKRYFEIN